MRFWVFWFIGLFFAGIRDVLHPDNATLTINLFGWGRVFQGGWTAWAGAPLMLAAGLGMVVYFRYLARNEDKFLIDFVRRTLEAQNGR